MGVGIAFAGIIKRWGAYRNSWFNAPAARSTMRILQRGVGMLLMLTVIFALPGCGLLGFHSWEWNQKVTIRVKTPDGERIGSAVQRVSWSESPSWARLGDSGGWFSDELAGEAAVVEVRPGKHLFVLLKSYSEMDNLKIFAPEKASSSTLTGGLRAQFQGLNDRLEGGVEAHDIPRALYPQLATFGDISNSATVQLVMSG